MPKLKITYPSVDPEKLADHYVNHVSSMTGERLHAKSDIAEQLAYRDAQVEFLKGKLIEFMAGPNSSLRMDPAEARVEVETDLQLFLRSVQ